MAARHTVAAWRRITSYPHTKLVLLDLARRADSGGLLTTTLKDVADACLLSPRAARDDIARMVLKGTIAVLERRRYRAPGERWSRLRLKVHVFPHGV